MSTTICILALAVFISGAFAQVQHAEAAKTSPVTWTVLVGGEAAIEPQEYGPSGAWQFMRFYPENITINVGDKIVWKLEGSEPHTVTFPIPGEKIPDLIIPENNSSQRLLFNPLAILQQGGATYNGKTLTGSGQLDVQPNFPREYNLTFTKPGDFGYFCAFHSMRKGGVVVQPTGTPYPKTQKQIDLETAKLLAADVEAALKATLKTGNVSTRSGPNGTIIHEIKLGYGNGSIALMRFIPTDLTIHAGDTVEWTRGDVETPHTITFLSGGKEPELVLVEPQQSGSPKFVLNPVVLMPTEGKVYNGTNYFNSGAIWGIMVPLPGPQNYSLTFDKPGTYEYICIFHDYMGMKGQISVVPKI
ncbi:MAG: plastocyanin/azurin family copper-binding protein [Methanotrichaceae archaeon]|nr:plastocyanin/azurin family copper-binding protein [Methanotrichaceae archaeon]